MSFDYSKIVPVDKYSSWKEPARLESNNENHDPISYVTKSILDNQKFSSDKGSIENSVSLSLEPKGVRIALAKKSIDCCMKSFSQRNPTHSVKFSERLVEWLILQDGGALIRSYEEFVELATLLNSGEYDIPEAPSKLDFEKSMLMYAQLTGTKYEAAKEARIAFASDGLNSWKRIFRVLAQSLDATDSQDLLEWLFRCQGGELIRSYEEFVELATLLNSGEYDIPEAPSKLDFEKSMLKYAQRTGTKYEAAKEARIAFACEQFDSWMKKCRRFTLPDSEWLVKWLYEDGGAGVISDHKEFVELSVRLNRGEYQILQVPSKRAFVEAMAVYARNMGTSFEAEKETRIALASEEFDSWMNKGFHYGTHADELGKWYCDRYQGAELINDYEEFLELAALLNRGAYDIPEGLF